MSTMENATRPIAITIIDIFAALIPGFIWFVLIATTREIILGTDKTHVASPLTAWQHMATAMKETDHWLALVTLAVISLVIGYLLKPASLTIAEMFTRYFFKLGKKTRRIPLKELNFPFNGIYRETRPYQQVVDLLKQRIGFPPDELPGHQPFGAAKRYLRIISPSLWDESERMEAEVRLIGVIFLASLYSVVLSGSTLALQYFAIISNSAKTDTLGWLIISILSSLVLAEGFNRLRVREVALTYLNILLASDFHKSEK